MTDQAAPDPCADLRTAARASAHELNNTLSVLRLTLDLLEGEQLDIPSAAAQLRSQVDEAGQHVRALQRVARGEV